MVISLAANYVLVVCSTKCILCGIDIEHKTDCGVPVCTYTDLEMSCYTNCYRLTATVYSLSPWHRKIDRSLQYVLKIFETGELALSFMKSHPHAFEIIMHNVGFRVRAYHREGRTMEGANPSWEEFCKTLISKARVEMVEACA